MKTRSIGILAVLAAVTVFLGLYSAKQREEASAAGAQDEFLFPALNERINDVAELEVKTAEASFTLALDETDWGMVEKSAFPVDEGKVRKLLFALKDAVIVEPKTSKEALYPKLGVEGVDVEDAPSVELRVRASDGEELAAVVVGNRGESRTMTRYYVRRAGEAPSYLVEADLTVDRTDKAWLEKEIIDITRDRVRAIEILHAGGERVFAHKLDRAATEFELADIPAGKELRYAGAPGSLANGMARLSMEDVRPAADVELPGSPLAVTTFWTYDGLKVATTLYEVEGELLATFTAEVDEEGPAVDGFDGQGLLVEGGMAEALPEEGAAEGDDPEQGDQGPTKAQVESEAMTLRDKAAPWVYVLPSWKKSTLAKTMEELTKDIPEPEPDEASPEATLDLGLDPADLPTEQESPVSPPAEDFSGVEGEASEAPGTEDEPAGDEHAGHDHADSEHGDHGHGDDR